MNMLRISDQEFERLVEYMYSRYGINLSQKRILVEGRLSLLLSQRGYADYTSYINDLMSDRTGQEASQLVSKLTTNFTYFLREEGHYDFMAKTILPAWRIAAPGQQYYIWSAACSSGEEPYSIAMSVANHYGFRAPSNVRIVASDISEHVLQKARAGVYGPDQTEKLPQGWVTRFFQKTGDGKYEVKQTLRDMIEYRYFNLNDTLRWPVQQYDVIFCRNVMIYFDLPAKQRLIRRLHEALRPGGYLFIGMSETLVNLMTDFTYIQPSIYQKK